MPDTKEAPLDTRTYAWKLLKEEGFNSLPIRPSHFIKKHQIVLWTYHHYSEVSNCAIEELIETYGSDGFILYFQKEYLIIYNETMPRGRIRWTMMHAIAHFLLGHITEECPIFIRNPSSSQPLDLEADQLVARLFCPSAILHMCCVQSADEIAALCGISHTAAENRWKHLKKLRGRNKFLTTPEEQELIPQFAPFICRYLCNKFKQKEENT